MALLAAASPGPGSGWYATAQKSSGACGGDVNIAVVDDCGMALPRASLRVVEADGTVTDLAPNNRGVFRLSAPTVAVELTASVDNLCDESVVTDTHAVDDVCGGYTLKVESSFSALWPLSGSCTTDEMTTSFGPRVNAGRWNFHDGIDLLDTNGVVPAGAGETVYAIYDGEVVHLQPPTTDPDRSSRVVVESCDPRDGERDLYVNYIHAVTDPLTARTGTSPGTIVTRGAYLTEIISSRDDPKASHDHLHLEIRKGGEAQEYSVHPLRYLPYADTANFEFGYPDTKTPLADLVRWNVIDGATTARIPFGAPDRREGDLAAVWVGLACPSGPKIIDVTLDRKSAFHPDLHSGTSQASGDAYMYGPAGGDLTYFFGATDARVGIEGYQRSNMVNDGFESLHYAIMVTDLDGCELVAVRVFDLAGNNKSQLVRRTPAPALTRQGDALDFEPGGTAGCASLTLPTGWAIDTGGGLADPTVVDTAAHAGDCGLLGVDDQTASGFDWAALRWTLPVTTEARFEWAVRARLRPDLSGLVTDESLYPLIFRRAASGETTVAARMKSTSITAGSGSKSAKVDAVIAALRAEDADGDAHHKTPDDPYAVIETDEWRHWRLHLSRIGTRMTTAALYLDVDSGSGLVDEEVARLVWDGRGREPEYLRTGLALVSEDATASLDTDDVAVSEDPCEILPSDADVDCD